MAIRIPSGVTDQYVYFDAFDVDDYVTRLTGLSSFTVYRSRNGGAAAAFTTPTINETDSTNMPGVYELLLDEDMTIDSGDDSQAMKFYVAASGMVPVAIDLELYRPKITAGETIGVSSGAVSNVTLVATLTTYTGNTVQTGDAYARIGANGAGLSAVPWNASWDAEVQSEVDDALIAKGLDHLVFTSVAGADVADNSIIAKIVSKSSTADWDSFVNTTDALEGIRDNMGTAQTGDAYAIVNSGTHGNAALKTLIDALETVATGTADSGTTLTMVDAARTEADTDYWKGCWILFTSGTISGQCRQITGFTPGTDTITFAPATTQAVSTQTYEILPAAAVDVRLWNGTVPSSLISGRVDANAQEIADGLLVAAKFATNCLTAAKFASDVGDEFAASLLDLAAGVETNRTVRQGLRLMLAALAGKLSGAGTTTVVIRDTNDGVNRISATVDAAGNRSAVTLDAS